MSDLPDCRIVLEQDVTRIQVDAKLDRPKKPEGDDVKPDEEVLLSISQFAPDSLELSISTPSMDYNNVQRIRFKYFIEYEDLINPSNIMPNGDFKVYYSLDDSECDFCWQLKEALNVTAENLRNAMTEYSNENIENPSEETTIDVLHETSFTETRIVPPMAQFFSRLIRHAAITKMKKFSQSLEAKLPQPDDKTEPIEDIKDKEEQEDENMNAKAAFKEEYICESCKSLRQGIFFTIKKLYESSGLQNDFPIVKKLENCECLTSPQSWSDFFEEERRQKRLGILKDENKEEKAKRREKFLLESIKRHRKTLTLCYMLYVLSATCVAFVTVFMPPIQWLIVTNFNHSNPRVFSILLVLGFSQVFHVYLQWNHIWNVYERFSSHQLHCLVENETTRLIAENYNFRNFVTIPICMLLLLVTGGRCYDPIYAQSYCVNEFQHYALMYVLIMVIQYYITCALHAVLILSLNQHRRMRPLELLKNSFYNAALIIPVIAHIGYVLSKRFGFWAKKKIVQAVKKRQPSV